MALRLSREDTLIDQSAALNEVGTLPSVARVMATADAPADEDADTPDVPDPETGDEMPAARRPTKGRRRRKAHG